MGGSFEYRHKYQNQDNDIYTLTEKEMIIALKANGYIFCYTTLDGPDEWVPKGIRNDRGGMELKEAFEHLLRKNSIK